jgi:simple sugar transport system permease protein
MIPIIAGLGLNFGIVLGAMAGQAGLILVENYEVSFFGTFGGFAVAVCCSIPIALFLGYLTGLLFNRCRGNEMITGIILGFFANGIYQFVFLILTGPVIPFRNPDILLPQGTGTRVTVNLVAADRGLDAPWEKLSIPLRFAEDGRWWGEIPIPTMIVAILFYLGIWLFLRTKLGQDLRAVGQDPHVAEIAGINVNRCRVIAIILSMVVAGVGQVIWLQNMGVMNTYQSHEQVGFYAVAAILVGGASVTRVRIWNPIAGVVLFHTLIVVISTSAMRLGVAHLAEYFRQFFVFAVIGVTLAIHAAKIRRQGPGGAQESKKVAGESSVPAQGEDEQA